MQIFFIFTKAPRRAAPYIGMKTYKIKLTTLLVMALQLAASLLAGCGDRFPSGYVLELPKPPESWVSILGEPWWRLEWVDPGGRKQIADVPDSSFGSLEIELPVTWTNPVTAWPYWPNHNLIPGFFKPAGALFPFDVSGNRLRLSWEAGVDTVFYWELALANEDNYSRLPSNFDWPRFRELFTPETLSEAVCEDPWLVDWRSVAERTVAGNFDRRRLVPQATEAAVIPIPADCKAGPWYGSSPFAKPLAFSEEETPIFQLNPGINVWISADGILRANSNVWVFIEW